MRGRGAAACLARRLRRAVRAGAPRRGAVDLLDDEHAAQSPRRPGRARARRTPPYRQWARHVRRPRQRAAGARPPGDRRDARRTAGGHRGRHRLRDRAPRPPPGWARRTGSWASTARSTWCGRLAATSPSVPFRHRRPRTTCPGGRIGGPGDQRPRADPRRRPGRRAVRVRPRAPPRAAPRSSPTSTPSSCSAASVVKARGPVGPAAAGCLPPHGPSPTTCARRCRPGSGSVASTSAPRTTDRPDDPRAPGCRAGVASTTPTRAGELAARAARWTRGARGSARAAQRSHLR